MTGMEDVLMEHGAMASTSYFPAGTHVTCMCDWTYRTHSDHATHVAEALTAAGFGSLRDAWEDGAEALTDHWANEQYSPHSNGNSDPPANPYPAPKVSET